MGTMSRFEKHLPYFEDRYTFDICPANRVNDLMSFIGTYWKKDHIFARSPEFLKWQHYDKENDRYTYIVAVHKSTDEIHSIVGFTLTSHFDPNITNPIYWGSLWKNRPDIDEPGLGMMVAWKTHDLFGHLASAGFGFSKMAINLIKKTYPVMMAEQYYILHPSKSAFKIAANKHSDEQNFDNNTRFSLIAVKSGKKLIPCDKERFISLDGSVTQTIPTHKSKQYYVNRFFNHPIYDYKALMICNPNLEVYGVIFWRFCYHGSAKCIRIVDYFGEDDALPGCLNGFLDLLSEHDAEYIDFICGGMQEAVMEAAGFLNRRNNPEVIIPNYFEPFVQANIDISYALYHPSLPVDPRIFKGDSDQDRPS